MWNKVVKKLTKKEAEAYLAMSNSKQVRLWTNLFIAGILFVFGLLLAILAACKFLWLYLVG
jgi:hypothetical protein